ncbi:epithelial-stromal interaction protein 1 [Lepisosteus oculatus]|uniref:epithelial-stromal interaction protein 1 n=1 Tax=Lepisosteus oculatus TaxID=7918 RepID=UPI0035F51107
MPWMSSHDTETPVVFQRFKTPAPLNMERYEGTRSRNDAGHFSNKSRNSRTGDTELAVNNNDEFAHGENVNNQAGEENNTTTRNERNPQYMGGYSMIPPNESRRREMQRMAQKEEEDLKRWKEGHRPGPLSLPPAQLGGAISMTEARQRQFLELRESKYRKKLKQEDDKRKRKEAEEMEIQQKKVLQREKAIRLEERRRQEENLRKEQLRYDHQLSTQQFLQRFENFTVDPVPVNSSLPASSWARGHIYREAQKAEENEQLRQKKEEQRRKSELLEENQKWKEEERERELQKEHKRVNAKFLDQIQAHAQSGRKELPFPVNTEEERDFHTNGAQDVPKSLEPILQESEEDGYDLEWTVMKLQTSFPSCERAFLEDIVIQCNGDYNQAYKLLL